MLTVTKVSYSVDKENLGTYFSSYRFSIRQQIYSFDIFHMKCHLRKKTNTAIKFSIKLAFSKSSSRIDGGEVPSRIGVYNTLDVSFNGNSRSKKPSNRPESCAAYPDCVDCASTAISLKIRYPVNGLLASFLGWFHQRVFPQLRFSRILHHTEAKRAESNVVVIQMLEQGLGAEGDSFLWRKVCCKPSRIEVTLNKTQISQRPTRADFVRIARLAHSFQRDYLQRTKRNSLN